MAKESLTWHQFDIRLLLVAASLLLSAVAILGSGLPNDDAYVYIRTAEIFSEEGLTAAYRHYPWATYSILIGALHSTGLELFQAAYILNGIFFAIFAYAFASLASEIRDDKLFVMLASITVLIYPELNEYRTTIVRDIGFWASSLIAIIQFLRYCKNPSIANALGFCALNLLGATMRPEALIYLFLLPCVIFMMKNLDPRSKRKAFLTMQGLSVLSISILCIALLIAGADIVSLVATQFEAYGIFLASAFDFGVESNAAVITQLFGSIGALNSAEWFWLFMLFGLTALLFAELAASIGLPCLLLLGWGWNKGWLRIETNAGRVVLGMALVNIFIVACFIYVARFLDSRYSMLFSLAVMLFVPMVLTRLFEQSNQERKAPRFTAIVIIVYLFIDAYVSFGRDKSFIHESVAWILNNSDNSVVLLTNNRSVAYYSGMIQNYDELRREISAQEIRDMNQGDFIALEIYYESEQLLNSEEVSGLLIKEVSFPALGLPRIEVYSRNSR